jgi:hypothetical protein
MFFEAPHQHLFRPLTGKYREQVVACLRELYSLFYGYQADYSRNFHREQLIELFQQAVTRTPTIDDDGEEEQQISRNDREQAGWILNQLLEYGWLERLVDEATLRSSYAFTRYGRLFTQPMVETSEGRFRTRHRNTRNTRNALQSFVEKGEAYDLLDAYEHSERIVADFSDVIAELDERKRKLVKAVEAQQVIQRASDEFFDFMEKRFMPDLAIRLSADSVERYRDEIQELLQRARRKRKEFKTDAERELRRVAPELLDNPNQSLLLKLLDGIEARLSSAGEVMLPALRDALNGFTRRADIIIRQLSYQGGSHNRIKQLCESLKSASPEQQQAALAAGGETMAVLDARLVDPDALHLHGARRPRRVDGGLEQTGEISADNRKAMAIARSGELAFTFNSRQMQEYLQEALKDGGALYNHELSVDDAVQLMMNAHLIEAGALRAADQRPLYRIRATGRRRENAWFTACDEFTIEPVAQKEER